MAVREVQARQGRSTDRRDMLSRFLKQHEKNPQEFTMDDVYRNGAMTMYEEPLYLSTNHSVTDNFLAAGALIPLESRWHLPYTIY